MVPIHGGLVLLSLKWIDIPLTGTKVYEAVSKDLRPSCRPAGGFRQLLEFLWEVFFKEKLRFSLKNTSQKENCLAVC